MNWVVWYDTDQVQAELFINGVTQGITDTGAGGFVHSAGSKFFALGGHFVGFISNFIVMTPGEGDLSAYFD